MRGHWKPIVAVLATLALVGSPSVRAQGDSAPRSIADTPDPHVGLDRTKVEAFVDGAVGEAMRESRIAGVTVAVVDRSGTVMTKGYGLAGVAPDRSVTADTLFRVGSISKTPVWIAVMRLVEEGKIGLDDPINSHLPPDLRIPDEGFHDPIRVRHLMTHSAGFEDSVLGGFFVADADHLMGINAYLRTHRVHRVREPGVLAVYSNYGAALAGALVAHVSGEAWPDYAERHIFRPLGMTTATYREPYTPAQAKAHGLPTPMPPDIAAKVSSGFDVKAGALSPQHFEYIGHLAPAGALSASAHDMATYLSALLEPSILERAGVLKAASFETLRGPLFANSPEMGSWRHGFMDYAIHKGRPGFGHGGDLIYQHSTLEIYPDPGIGVFVSVNTPTGEGLRETLSTNLLAAFAGPAGARPQRVANAKAEAARVVGVYRSLRRPSFRTEAALLRFVSTLEIKATPEGDIVMPAGDHVARYSPVGGGVFAAADGPGRIAFHERNGRMLRFDSFSAGPMERIGFLEGALWLVAVVGLSAITAIWGVTMGIRRSVRRREQGRAAGLILDGLCLTWLIALGLFGAGVASFSDQNAAVLTYPGPILPIGCWALLGATIATPLAILLVIFAVRPRGWGAWRWTRQAVAMAVFTTLSATLWQWGLLGYSGW